MTALGVERPTVVLLGGASSSGKSSAGVELQRITRLPSVFMPSDDLELPRPSTFMNSLSSMTSAERNKAQLALDHAYTAALAAFPPQGAHAIGEVILKDADRLRAWRSGMAPVRHRLVHLYCDQEELQRREDGRNDRPRGLAVATAKEEISCDPDLELDVTSLNPPDVAQRIYPLLCVPYGAEVGAPASGDAMRPRSRRRK